MGNIDLEKEKIRQANRENILKMYEDGLLSMEERNCFLESFWCITKKEIAELILKQNREKKPSMYPTPKTEEEKMIGPTKIYKIEPKRKKND